MAEAERGRLDEFSCYSLSNGSSDSLALLIGFWDNMAFSINDYLIEQSGIDWPTVLHDWSWLLPHKFKVWLVNRFADLFLVLPDRSVHMLDVGAGTLTRMADSRDDF